MKAGFVKHCISFSENLSVFLDELPHVRYFVVTLSAYSYIRQYLQATVSLQGTLAELQKHTQILIVEQPLAIHKRYFHHIGIVLLVLLAGKHRYQLVLTVKTGGYLTHPHFNCSLIQCIHRFIIISDANLGEHENGF